MQELRRGKYGAMNRDFWKGRRVLVTGHTGFKGSWLCLLLDHLGASVYGYALDPPTKLSMFVICNVFSSLKYERRADICDEFAIRTLIESTKPDVIFHLAAQTIVNEAYRDPLATYQTNVIGTATLLNSIASTHEACDEPTKLSVVIVTSDKCYKNDEPSPPFKEGDELGGLDPYGCSKSCAELVTQSYRHMSNEPYRPVYMATARAGNVIGGGDWSADRIVPDYVRARMKGESLKVRNPSAIRPWQHVLEPLSGYMMLAESLYKHGGENAEAWNFGPTVWESASVSSLLDMMDVGWEGRLAGMEEVRPINQEAECLLLDSSKARECLRWTPLWGLEAAIQKTVDWYKAYSEGKSMREYTLEQIEEYLGGTNG